MSDDSNSIAAGSDHEAEVLPPALPGPQRRKRRRQQAAAGTFFGPYVLVLIISTAQGFWHAGNFGTTEADAVSQYPLDHAVALALCRYEFMTMQEASTKLPQPLLQLEKHRCRTGVSGMLAYSWKALARLTRPFPVGELNPRELMGHISELQAVAYDFDSRAWSSGSSSCQFIVAGWQQAFSIERPRFCNIEFGCKWIGFLLTFLPTFFHAVSLTKKLSRRRLISRNDAPLRLINSFLKSIAVPCQSQLSSGPSNVQQTGPRWLNAHHANIIIEWLNFSRDIKDQNNSWRALQSAAKVIAKSTSRSFNAVLQECRGVSGTVLKSARIRLDSVCMLLWRQFFTHLTDVVIYLYLDSSPQHLGDELFACSMEILDMTGKLPFDRKLLPLVSLPRDFLDAAGKVYALIWIVWLLCGPDIQQVTRFLNSVICVTTDMGTERLIARYPDVLNEFYTLLLNVPSSQAVRPSLLPMALQAPGWCHGWDTIMKRGLLSQCWFPSFLESLRSIIHFFRTKLLVEALLKKLRDQSLTIIAAMLAAVVVPSVAEWRWGTLRGAVTALAAVRDTLRMHWDAALFSNSKDPKTLRRVGLALNSIGFNWQFQFVLEFTTWLCDIQSWGKGSQELENSRVTGAAVDPMSLGRRLSEAEPYVAEALRKGLDAASLWDTNYFHGASVDDVDALKACCRASYVLAQKRHKYLSLVPWLLARLDAPGVKARCLQQYASHSAHHPMTDKFLHPDSELRADVDQIQEDGSGVSPRLKQWIGVIQRIPLDDSVAETPHALGNRIGRHGSRASFAWIAASMRLGQNLQDVQDLVPALGQDIEGLWYRHSSVLQTKPKNCIAL